MHFNPRIFRVGETIRTDWFARRGDNLLLRVQPVDNKTFDTSEGSVTVTFTIYTKNPDETPASETSVKDSGTVITLVVDEQDTAVQEAVVISGTSAGEGLEQEVLIEAACTGSDDRNWLSLVLLPPVFFDHAS